MTDKQGLVVSSSMRRLAIALVVAGAAALVLGLLISPERTWMNLLVDGFYVLSLGVSAMFFIATQRLSSARWSAPIRRIPEAYMLVLPAAAVLMIVLAFGFHSLYPWTSPATGGHEAELVTSVQPGRDTYLAPRFVYVRMVVVVALWIFFAWRIRKISLGADADRDAGLRAHQRLNRTMAVFTPVFALTFTAAAYDWIISLDPKWFSTMFAVYVFAGSFAQGIAAIALATVVLTRRGSFGPGGAQIGSEPLHTLGTMLLAFSTFWAYIWVCQYLLIWYGNIPEEVTFYLRRSTGSWLPLFLGSFVVNWIIPFFTLLPRSSKRSLRVMAAMSILVLLGHWLDLYIMVMPSQWEVPHIGLLEIAMAAGCGGLIFLIFIRGLARAPLVPPHDPVLVARRAHAAHAEGGAS
ncbi:MAG TPA: hypothetical protein VHN14_16570 [Kofleriaceae bacterium]|jgi:hypothetical protein|nr:hypothetical protein [Kofleriaceae bacterium]